MQIGGEEVWRVGPIVPPHPTRGPFTVDMFAKVMFDSTHFTTSSIEVKFFVKADGVTYSHTYSAPRKNVGLALTDGEAPPAGAVVESRLDLLNYNASSLDGGGWNSVVLLWLLPGVSVLYIAAHGSEHVHYDDAVAANEVTPANYENALTVYVGTDNDPPYNASGEPPINLFWLYACNCGDNGVFHTALWPKKNIYTAQIENQAVVSFKVYVPIDQTVVMADTAFFALSFNATAEGAAIAVSADADHVCWDEYPEPGDLPRDLKIGDFRFDGDRYTRITGVYTGSNAGGIQWYRVLP